MGAQINRFLCKCLICKESENRTFDVRHPASRRSASHCSILNNGHFPESKKAMDGLFTTSSILSAGYRIGSDSSTDTSYSISGLSLWYSYSQRAPACLFRLTGVCSQCPHIKCNRHIFYILHFDKPDFSKLTRPKQTKHHRLKNHLLVLPVFADHHTGVQADQSFHAK